MVLLAVRADFQEVTDQSGVDTLDFSEFTPPTSAWREQFHELSGLTFSIGTFAVSLDLESLGINALANTDPGAFGAVHYNFHFVSLMMSAAVLRI